MAEIARTEVDINLRIAALRSLELGIYFKSLWRLPIAVICGPALRAKCARDFQLETQPRCPWLMARRLFFSRGEFTHCFPRLFSFRSTAKIANYSYFTVL